MGAIRGVLEPFGRTTEPAFVVDAQQRIVLWNAAAEALLGCHAVDVIGHPCYTVLAGWDVGGERCRRGCPTVRRARQGDLPPNCDLLVRTASGATIRVVAAHVVVPARDSGNPFVVHYLHLAPQPLESDPDPVQRDPGGSDQTRWPT